MLLASQLNADPNTHVDTPFVYDLAGNLVWDGRLFYQYDGFNRLVWVADGRLLLAGHFDAAGKLMVNPPGPLGPPPAS